MYFYQSPSTDPHFNIATEEYFLKNIDEDFFYLYINRPSVIVGKHQNTMAEINGPFVIENHIPVIRRLSGGGTVFHDSGNLNFCFIQQGTPGYLVDFKKFSKPILDLLQKLEVNAWLRGKSDLVINNLKFSGNAEHVYKNKVLHHGTLLFSSQLNQLNEVLKTDWDKFTDKAVRSNRSEVTNISGHLKIKLSLDAFTQLLASEVKEKHPEIVNYELSVADVESIQQLVTNKYSTWEWNFSYSPTYGFSRTMELTKGLLKVKFNVEKGMIQNMQCEFSGNMQPGIEKSLNGLRHDYIPVKEKIEMLFDQQPLIGFSKDELMTILF
jgi:lipoate-protein ligase A